MPCTCTICTEPEAQFAHDPNWMMKLNQGNDPKQGISKADSVQFYI